MPDRPNCEKREELVTLGREVIRRTVEWVRDGNIVRVLRSEAAFRAALLRTLPDEEPQ